MVGVSFIHTCPTTLSLMYSLPSPSGLASCGGKTKMRKHTLKYFLPCLYLCPGLSQHVYHWPVSGTISPANPVASWERAYLQRYRTLCEVVAGTRGSSRLPNNRNTSPTIRGLQKQRWPLESGANFKSPSQHFAA